MSWQNYLGAPSVAFLEEIKNQIPEEQGARIAFELLLNNLASAVSPENQRKLDELEALHAAGVDNWEGYDDAMSALYDEDEDEDEED